MSILQSIKRGVLARQGGRCARGEACLMADSEGRGCDLVAFKRAKALHKYLPRGRTAVEFDHVEPRAGGGADDADNIEALCGPCHHEKTQGERPGWEAPSPSPFAHRIPAKPRAEHLPASKAMSLRGKVPLKHYAS